MYKVESHQDEAVDLGRQTKISEYDLQICPGYSKNSGAQKAKTEAAVLFFANNGVAYNAADSLSFKVNSLLVRVPMQVHFDLLFLRNCID